MFENKSTPPNTADFLQSLISSHPKTKSRLESIDPKSKDNQI